MPSRCRSSFISLIPPCCTTTSGAVFYLYSWLGGATIAKRFVSRITQGLFTRLITELRHEFQLPNLSVKPMTELARRGRKQVSRYRRSRTSDRVAVGLGISDKERDQDRKLRQALEHDEGELS